MTGSASRKPRRVTRPAAEGVDLQPSDHPLGDRAAEDRPEGWGGETRGGSGKREENDEQLRRDRPPHWG